MSITDKLREAFDDCTVMAGVENDFECVYITKTAAMRLLDEIDAEHEKELAEQYASLTVDMEPMTDENMAKHGWVRLPKDADGVLGNDGVGRTNDGVAERERESCGKDAEQGERAEPSERESYATLRRTTTRNTTRTVYGNKRPICEVCGYGIGDRRWHYCPKCGAEVVE